MYFYILTMKNQKEKSRNQPHSPLQQKNKISRNYLPKETKILYTENYKTLMEKNQRWHKQMKRCSKFLGRKNQHCENDYTTKCNLQIQYKPCQITNGIFHRTRTKQFTIHMETSKTQNSQSSIEKEELIWKNQPSWLQIIQQSYSHQDTMVLVQKQKCQPMEQDRKHRNKPMHLWVPYFWQRGQEYTLGQRQTLQ